MRSGALGRRGCLMAGVGLLASGPLAWAAAPGPVVTVAAASDLQFALEVVAERYRQRTGQALRLVFGSSGQLYTQLLQGAPFHVFLSADESYALRLNEAGLTEGPGRLYAHGRLALLVRRDGPVQADPGLQDLQRALVDGRLQRLALAQPDHAPYGMRAQEALRHLGLWDRLSGHLVFGENVSQAVQFVVSGAAQAGLVAASLALAPAIASRSAHALLPAAWHRPLAQRMVLMKRAPAGARAFYDELSTPEVQALMAAYGFTAPKV